MSLLERLWRWLEKPIKVLTIGYTLLHATTLLGIVFVPWGFITSRSLRGYIADGAILGGVISFFFTSNAWTGVAKYKRLRRRHWYVIGAFLFYTLFIIAPVVTVRPQLAAKFILVHHIRDFLIDSMPLLKVIVFLGGLLTSFFAIGAICLSSPALDRNRKNHSDKQDHE